MGNQTNSQLDIQVGGDHYKTMKKQPLEMAFEFAVDKKTGEFDQLSIAFLTGVYGFYIAKYLIRTGRKEGTDDDGKAAHVAKVFGELSERNGLMEASKAEEYILGVANQMKEMCIGNEESS